MSIQGIWRPNNLKGTKSSLAGSFGFAFGTETYAGV